MKLLIKYIKKESHTTIVEGNKLSVGRGTDQNILLPDNRVALTHAKLTVTSSGISVSASAGKYVLFNEQMVKKCRLTVNQSIDISGHIITLLSGDKVPADKEAAEKGCDFVIEVKLNNEQQVALKDRYQTRLQDLNLGKRRWSWLLFLLIIIGCLIVPIMGVVNTPVMESLRDSALPDDSQWMAGKLMKSHQFMGDNCSQCHVEPFVQVNNQQCQTCHNETKHHVDVEGIAVSFDAFNECTDCHKEHNDEDTLAQYSQKVCVSCHSDSELGAEHISALKNKDHAVVTDFEQQHPSFTATMLISNTLTSKSGEHITGHQSPLLQKSSVTSHGLKVVQSANKELTRKALLADKNSKEQSNLNFSHKLHMDPKGINSATSTEVLACANCHEAEKGGLQMKPITMEQHCQSCHTLTFDVEDPERVVPHGSPTDVVMMMREYYAFRYIYQQLNIDSDNVVQTAGDLFSIREARRPGRDKKLRKSVEAAMNAQTIASIEKLTKDTVRTDALLWAESRASNAAFDLFERQACAVCHVVSKIESTTESTVENIAEKVIDETQTTDIPWHVEPVLLTKTWLPASRFSHEEHETTQCIDCHQGQSSELSSDILIPDIDNCRQCHGGEHSVNLIPNTCIDCHDFHQATVQHFGPNESKKAALFHTQPYAKPHAQSYADIHSKQGEH